MFEHGNTKRIAVGRFLGCRMTRRGHVAAHTTTAQPGTSGCVSPGVGATFESMKKSV